MGNALSHQAVTPTSLLRLSLNWGSCELQPSLELHLASFHGLPSQAREVLVGLPGSGHDSRHRLPPARAAAWAGMWHSLGL